MTKPLEFWSEDNLFGARIFESELKVMLQLSRASRLNETGGILVGNYTNAQDCAVVSEIISPPLDSESGRTWFRRGTKDVKKKLNDLWKTNRKYYLGEWHFHPGGSPEPSERDKITMHKIANSTKYKCPEPILIIIGGSIPNNWQVRAFIFQRNRIFLELYLIN